MSEREGEHQNNDGQHINTLNDKKSSENFSRPQEGKPTQDQLPLYHPSRYVDSSVYANPYTTIYRYIDNHAGKSFIGDHLKRIFVEIRPYHKWLEKNLGTTISNERFFISWFGSGLILYILLMGLLPFYLRLAVGFIAIYHGYNFDGFLWLITGSIGAYYTKMGRTSDSLSAIGGILAGASLSIVGPLLYTFKTINAETACVIMIPALIYLAMSLGRSVTKHSMSQATNIFAMVMILILFLIVILAMNNYSVISNNIRCLKYQGSRHIDACLKAMDNQLERSLEDDFGVPKTTWAERININRFRPSASSMNVLNFIALVMSMSVLMYYKICDHIGTKDRNDATNKVLSSKKDWRNFREHMTGYSAEWFRILTTHEALAYGFILAISGFDDVANMIAMSLAYAFAVMFGYILYYTTTQNLYVQSGTDTAAIPEKLVAPDGSVVAGVDVRYDIKASMKSTATMTLILGNFFTGLTIHSTMAGVLSSAITYGAISYLTYTKRPSISPVVYGSVIIACMLHANPTTVCVSIAAGFAIQLGIGAKMPNAKSNNVARALTVHTADTISQSLPDA